MSLDWNKHAKCCNAVNPVCNADRAEMIAEGERLQAHVAWLMQFRNEQTEQVMAENARLTSELKLRHETIEYWTSEYARLNTLLDEVLPVNQRERMADLQAENARLREALEKILQVEKYRLEFPAGGYATFTASSGEWQGIVRAARAALSGETAQPLEKQSGDKP